MQQIDINNITAIIDNDNTQILLCYNKKRKINEDNDTIDYKELYESEQEKSKALKDEIIMIKYECLRLITEHTEIQTSITILQVSIYILFLILLIILTLFLLIEWY